MRNLGFDMGILTQTQFNIPVIGIGNLSLGGTGKTPHIEYFIRHFDASHRIAVVSRGYGRARKGLHYVLPEDSVAVAGDEPLQIKNRFPHIVVAVHGNRVEAIRSILRDYPEINMILLDDAFQHRYVKRDVNLLLTDYSEPFWKDAVLPAGRLREFSSGWKRADALIVTKCPEHIQLEIPKAVQQIPVYYSRIVYNEPLLLSGDRITHNAVVVTGIANPDPLLKHLISKSFHILKHFDFPDHHTFSESDIHSIRTNIQKNNATLVTTEKDWMRLKIHFGQSSFPIAIIPIRVEIQNAPHNWLAV